MGSQGAASMASGTISKATMASISPAVKLSSRLVLRGDSRLMRAASTPPRARPPTPVAAVKRMTNRIGFMYKRS